jgi:hypothetical protein
MYAGGGKATDVEKIVGLGQDGNPLGALQNQLGAD